MSKYQDIMNKIEVTDEMRSRILQNIEKEIGKESGSGKIRKFDFKRYMPMVAGLLVFIFSAYVVINVIPSHKPAYESATTAPMEEADSVMYEAEPATKTENTLTGQGHAPNANIEEASDDLSDGSITVTDEKDASPVVDAGPGFFERIIQFFKGIIDAIKNLFR